MTLRAFRVTEYASGNNGWKEEREDITQEILALKRDPGLRIVKLNGNKGHLAIVINLRKAHQLRF